jgi:hypothetical protein
MPLHWRVFSSVQPCIVQKTLGKRVSSAVELLCMLTSMYLYHWSIVALKTPLDAVATFRLDLPSHWPIQFSDFRQTIHDIPRLANLIISSKTVAYNSQPPIVIMSLLSLDVAFQYTRSSGFSVGHTGAQIVDPPECKRSAFIANSAFDPRELPIAQISSIAYAQGRFLEGPCPTNPFLDSSRGSPTSVT